MTRCSPYLSSNTATSATPVQSNVTARWSALNGTEYGTAETLAYPGTRRGPVHAVVQHGPAQLDLLVDGGAAQSTRQIRAPRPPPAPLVRSSAGGVSLSWSPRCRLGRGRLPGAGGRPAGRRALLTPGLVAGPLLTSARRCSPAPQPGWVDRRPGPGCHLSRRVTAPGRNTRWTPAIARPGKPRSYRRTSVASSLRRCCCVRARSPGRTRGDPGASSPPGSREFQWQLAGATRSSSSSRRPASSGSRPSPSLPRGSGGHRSLRSSCSGRAARSGGAVLSGGRFDAPARATRSSSTDTGWTPGTPARRSTGSPRARDGRHRFRRCRRCQRTVDGGAFLAATEVRERLTWFGAAPER